MFNRMCFFNVQDTGIDLDDLTLELIDFGAEEVERDEEANQIIVSAPFESFGFAIQAGGWLRNCGERLGACPDHHQGLDEAQTEELESLIEKLEGDDDVQAVFHTWNLPSADLCPLPSSPLHGVRLKFHPVCTLKR